MPPKRRDKILLRSTSHEAKSSRTWEVPLSAEDLPDAKTQREIIETLRPDEDDHETYFYEYAVCKHWNNTWRKYIGYAEGKQPGQTLPPGPIQMNQHPDNNTHFKGYIWKKLLEWYGLDDDHELDRRYTGDEGGQSDYEGKLFEICVLSPMVAILDKQTKMLDMKEYVGYIECQIRRILKVPNYRQTRLWICKKGHETQFVMLRDRTEELWFAHGIDDHMTYVIGVEICGEDGVWPTGQTCTVEGDLDLFTKVTQGNKWTQKWKNDMAEDLTDFVNTCFTQMKGCMERYLHGMYDREDKRIKDLQHLKTKLHQQKLVNKEFCEALETKSAELDKQAENFRNEKNSLAKKEGEFKEKKQRFEDELQYLDELNKITDKVIKLNVGGHVFMTSTLTLTRDPDSMLAAMFSGRHKLYTTPDGAVFIDRDGTHFRHILNFLRDGFLRSGALPSDPSVVEELIAEAEYYQLQGFLDFLSGKSQMLDTNADTLVEFVGLAGMYDAYENED